jgi:hypothetical protein
LIFSSAGIVRDASTRRGAVRSDCGFIVGKARLLANERVSRAAFYTKSASVMRRQAPETPLFRRNYEKKANFEAISNPAARKLPRLIPHERLHRVNLARIASIATIAP